MSKSNHVAQNSTEHLINIGMTDDRCPVRY